MSINDMHFKNGKLRSSFRQVAFPFWVTLSLWNLGTLSPYSICAV